MRQQRGDQEIGEQIDIAVAKHGGCRNRRRECHQPAPVEGGAVGKVFRPDAAADTIAGFENGDRLAFLLEFVGRRQPRDRYSS